jgi:hypothetical protein
MVIPAQVGFTARSNGAARKYRNAPRAPHGTNTQLGKEVQAASSPGNGPAMPPIAIDQQANASQTEHLQGHGC